MVRRTLYLTIVVLVILICAVLFAVFAHRLSVSPSQYGRFAVEYSRLAVGDLYDYVKSSLTRPSTDFRFETYDPDELVTSAAMTEAAEADLSRLFPIGTSVEPFVDLMNQLGARCYNLNQPDRPLSCGYAYATWTKFVRIGIHWTVDVYRDETGEKIERFRIKVVGRM